MIEIPLTNERQTSMIPHLIFSRHWFLILTAIASFAVCGGDSASAQQPIPYGEAISLEQAKKIMAAAEAEAKKNEWPVAIAIVDQAGFLVAFQRLENTQLGSVEVALQKAKTSALFRRPTKVFEDGLAQGGANLRFLKLPGALPLEGGLPIVHEGKIIGAIGVSGVKSTEDAQIASAGLKALEAAE
jgi:glc operon protein GlcG